MNPMTTQSKHVTVAVVGAGMAGQAHMFGYRNATMHPDLAGIDVRLAAVVDFNEDLARSAAARYGFAAATTDLHAVLRDETGMRLVFHPHAESHVETDEQVRRFLADTDPERVGLCLDTGHVAYTRGNAPPLIREHAGRIWYVHLKAVDPGVLARVEAERLSFADAVRRDVMCEPGLGVPDLDDLTAALGSLPDGTFVIVEQDLYPCDVDRPYPIAARTRKTLQAAGIG